MPPTPPPSDATWDAADWQPQIWDGEKWIDAPPPEGGEPQPEGTLGYDGDDGSYADADGDEGVDEEGWEYADSEADRRRKLVVGSGIAVTVLLLLAAIVVALTGGGTESEVTATPGTTAPPPPVATEVVERAAPLTGVLGDADELSRPALIVKIDNVDDGARPQSGINQADVVFEEKVEGPNSRFAAVFHSTDAEKLGPIRSARTTDVLIVSSFNRPLLAFSGANPTFRSLIQQADVVDIGADVQEGAYYRDSTRDAPYNLYSSTDSLWRLGMADRPPEPMFTFRKATDAVTESEPSRGVRYDWGAGQNPVEFTWNADGKVWEREQNGTAHVDSDGVQIAPANVVVLFVDYVDTDVNDSAGTPIPEAEFEGDGDAWVFTDGRIVRGSWAKATPDAIPTITDDAGRVIGLTPGRSWVTLAPNGSATVK